MDAVNKRAFPRIYHETPIIYAYSLSDIFQDGRMVNCSEGGMYLETLQGLMPGSEILIKMMGSIRTPSWFETCENYCGEVVWCKSLANGSVSRYGVGVRFLLNICDRCGEKIPYNEIRKIDKYIVLCQDCYRQLNALSRHARESVESYLLGNVV